MKPLNERIECYKYKEGKKMEKLYEDDYTTVEVSKKYGYVTRQYTDAKAIRTKMTVATALALVDAMEQADDDPNAMPSHYISRHVRELYPTL